jgi:hypothetical protein
MGVEANVGVDRFPAQGNSLGKSFWLCFNYDTSNKIEAVCVRDDMEAPFATIFETEDGRYILGTECQYSPRIYGSRKP